jgi:glycosyltransferase involved in cell wall biosynthesis/peptidoglycan/xylan/chitin deacetylase (PgdA/CDA1 family)
MSSRVSVVIIFYNAAAFIREAIDSVRDQRFREFELLLVDDGSTDSSTRIAKEYEALDPERVRYLDHPGHLNRGMSAARNLGVSAARGEFIAFIDADDRWRPSKLEEQVALLDRMPQVHAVGGSVNYWASHNGGEDRIVPTGHVRDRVIPPGQATLQFYPLGKANAPSMSDLLFRRSAILAVGGFEERFRGAYEDQAFLAKLYLNSALIVTNTVWSDYRLHENSCMARLSQAGGYHETRRAFLEWFERYLAARGDSDPKIAAALAQALRPYRPKGLIEQARALLRETSAGSVVRTAKAAARRLRPIVAPGPAILMYHRIADETFDPWGLAVSPRNFEDQLNWVKRHRTALPLAEFVERNRQGTLPRDAIAVTFDDGYACSAQKGMPVLEQLGIPATIFLPSELVERGDEFWWDKLERIVMESSSPKLELNGIEIVLGAQSEDADWPPAKEPRTPRQRAYHRLWSMLYEQPLEIDQALERLRVQAGVSDVPRETHRPLTRNEILATRSGLIEFGSHALTHPSLPKIGPEERARQIRESFSACADLTGGRPYAFAYPYGDHDADSQRLVEEAGYRCACKADGWFVRPRTNRFALPRIFVGNWDSVRLARQLGRP